MILAWTRALLSSRPPYLLHWQIEGREHYQVYGHLVDAWAGALAILGGGGPVECMALTDCRERPVPYPAHSTLTWSWGQEVRSEVLRSPREARRRLQSVAHNRVVEFVSLLRPDGRPALSPEGFARLRARPPGAD